MKFRFGEKGIISHPLLFLLVVVFAFSLIAAVPRNMDESSESSQDIAPESGTILGEVVEDKEEVRISLATPQNFKLEKIECRESGGAKGYFSWSKVENATHFRIHIENKEGKELSNSIVEGTNYKFELNSEIDTYISLAALKKSDGKIIGDSSRSEKVLSSLSAIKSQCGMKAEIEKEEPKAETTVSKELLLKAELDKKRIEELEKELAKKRSIEEQEVQDKLAKEKLAKEFEELVIKQDAEEKKEFDEKIKKLEEDIAENKEKTNNLQKVVDRIVNFFSNLFNLN